MKQKNKVIELFCGAGLLGAGFSKVGCESVLAVDLDKDAVSTYNKNLNNVAKVHDVNKVIKGIKSDIIVAGPPCQGFSMLGKRDKDDFRNQLSLKIVDWAKEARPTMIVIENVPQFLNTVHFVKLRSQLTKLKYESVSWILNAKDYGTPQSRKRSFTIFSKVGLPEKPKELKEKLTVKDAFKGLPIRPSNDGLHSVPPPTELMMKRFKAIKKNGNRFDIMKVAPSICPKSWFKMGNQTIDIWGRMDWNKPSHTIRCSFQSPSKGRYIHPTENRIISLREGARLQGIPDSWQFIGSRTSVARQIGNGVPIPLAEAVAKTVMKMLKN